LFYNSICAAQLRDPTKPAHFSLPVKIEQEQADSLHLSSIWVSKASKRATINGIVVKQGDVILSDIKIVKINTHAVLIKQNGRVKKLTILAHSYKTK
jgi:hypothetical protein